MMDMMSVCSAALAGFSSKLLPLWQTYTTPWAMSDQKVQQQAAAAAAVQHGWLVQMLNTQHGLACALGNLTQKVRCEVNYPHGPWQAFVGLAAACESPGPNTEGVHMCCELPQSQWLLYSAT
jgi:hypothetical protein